MIDSEAFSSAPTDPVDEDDSTDIKGPGRSKVLIGKVLRGITSLIIELVEITIENLGAIFEHGPKPKGVSGTRVGFDKSGGTQTIWVRFNFSFHFSRYWFYEMLTEKLLQTFQVLYNISHVKWIGTFSLILALSFCIGVRYGK